MTQDIYGLGDYNTAQIQELVKTLEEEHLDPTLVWYRRPDAAPDPAKTIVTIPLDETPYIIPDAFAGSRGVELTTMLSRDQLEAIGAHGDPFLKKTITMNLEKAYKANPTDSRTKERFDYVNGSPAWQF